LYFISPNSSLGQKPPHIFYRTFVSFFFRVWSMKNGTRVVQENAYSRSASLPHFRTQGNQHLFDVIPFYIRPHRIGKDSGKCMPVLTVHK